MKKFIVVQEETIEVHELTGCGDLPAQGTRLFVRDTDTGELWCASASISRLTEGKRFMPVNPEKPHSQVLMPVYEKVSGHTYTAETQCYITVSDYNKLLVFAWGNQPLPENFDLLDIESNPASDMFGVLLQNRLTGIKVIGQAGTLKPCEQ